VGGDTGLNLQTDFSNSILVCNDLQTNQVRKTILIVRSFIRTKQGCHFTSQDANSLTACIQAAIRQIHASAFSTSKIK